ncbi:hypothetical protein MLD38_002289 [Melastoma candidum]|uniref:Uncharacterized protein n=1 Tax=Melastoma candidum TaxID=119954 RepID=A0ACB9SFV3_9MYRT|nr:hypothetical protein MLD38_002289 [Melastoma candidum]
MGSPLGQFYLEWLDHLHLTANQLLSSTTKPLPSPDHLPLLISRFLMQYFDYYRVRSLAADHDIVSLLSTPWCTPLERSLHWIGSWRPTMVFHLVYTESSILFESHIIDILRGYRTGDLGDLSPSQLRMVSDLQCETVREENEINDELGEWQEAGACDLLLTISGVTDVQVFRLAEAVKKADELRLKTVRRVVELLTPRQAAEFLVSVAEMEFGARGLGMKYSQLSATSA